MGKWHKLAHTRLVVKNLIKKNQYMLGDNKYIMMKRRENFQQIDSELADLNMKLLKHFYAKT